jgi:hypothetical protein
MRTPNVRAVSDWRKAAAAAAQLYVRSRVNAGRDWIALETTRLTHAANWQRILL